MKVAILWAGVLELEKFKSTINLKMCSLENNLNVLLLRTQ